VALNCEVIAGLSAFVAVSRLKLMEFAARL
jgi:hypothetical protein